jgi:signal transduction histidine kinase
VGGGQPFHQSSESRLGTSFDQTHRLRSARFFLLSIVAIVLILLVLFTWSLIRHEYVLSTLSPSSLKLDGERLAVEIERAMWEAAENCLRDVEVQGLALRVITETDSDRQAQLGIELDKARSRHPIAQHLFVLLNDRVEFPHLTIPSSRQLLLQPAASGLPAEETTAMRQFAIARALENKLARADASDDPQRIRAHYVKNAAAEAQIFWLLVSDPGPDKRVLALSVDIAWVEGPLLKGCMNKLQSGLGTFPAFQIGQSTTMGVAQVMAPFRTVLPYLSLSLPSEAVQESREGVQESRKDMLIDISMTVGSILTMVTLVLIISVLLTRVSRDMGALQARSNLLGQVSHELKTPLTLISLYAETLLSDPSMSVKDRRKCQQVISRECGRLNNLIENQLHYSRIERAKSDYHMTEGDLTDVIRRTVDISGEWLSQQGFSLATDLASELPLVRFDPERVAQVLINLVDNARKYSGSSRSIDIRTYPDQTNVIVEVRDRGIGIPPGEQTRIFDQFYRATNANAETGTGLGLYVVTDIMRAHGGSIELESELGAGSTFRLVFPTVGPDAAKP